MRGKGRGHVWRRGRGMHGEGRCMAKGRGHVWLKGVCLVNGGMRDKGGMHGKGACLQERWPLKQAVRILLECILVTIIITSK